jgi:4-hydroxy-tetrahydrodipicolinate synthase
VSRLRGIVPYLVSPVDQPSGAVRERVLADLIEHLIAGGVHGLSPLGSTGEFASLTAAQRRDVVRVVVEAANGRVPVVPGVAAAATHDAIGQAREYVALGADAIVLILQPYFRLSAAEAAAYFEEVAAAVDCPIVVYTNPPLLGYDLDLDTVERLSRVPTIRYLKDASPNTGRLLSVTTRMGGRLDVFSASAHVPLLVFELGGVGWMAGPACVAPAECVALYDHFRAGRREEAWALQRRLWRLNELFQRYTLAACVKCALELQGFAVGDPIRPQAPLGEAARGEIRAALAALHLLPA